jgi:hypothetical protein
MEKNSGNFFGIGVLILCLAIATAIVSFALASGSMVESSDEFKNKRIEELEEENLLLKRALLRQSAGNISQDLDKTIVLCYDPSIMSEGDVEHETGDTK